MSQINLNVFSATMQAVPGFSNLVAIMERSPTLVEDLNNMAASGGIFELSGSQGSSASGNQIAISNDVLGGLTYDNNAALANIATLFAHELGHATQPGGEWDVLDQDNPLDAVIAGTNAEGVAATYEYKITNELSAGLGIHVNMWSNSPGNPIGNDGLQATLEHDAQKDADNPTQAYIDQVNDAASAFTNFTPSPAPGLTYGQYDADQWIAAKCGLTVDWSQATPSSFSDTVSTNGACNFSGTSVPILGGGGSAVGIAGQTSSNGALTSLSEVVYDENGDQIASYTLNTDGTTDLVQTDPATGNTYKTSFDAQGNPTSYPSQMSYSAFTSAVINTLATQIITKVLIKNNLPAAVAAQAFATATIQSAQRAMVAAQTGQAQSGSFEQDFATSVVGIAGGLAGSAVGADIAKALGIPTQAGSIIGGTAGNLVTQAIVNDALTEMGYSALTNVTFSTLGANFGAGLEDAGLSILGSYLGSFIAGNSTDAQIGSAVGSTAGAVIGSLFPGAGTSVGAFIGSFLGDLIGGLFDPPRGQPYAESNIFLQNNAYYIVSSTTDNNGSAQPAINLANDVIAILNQILSAVGGTASLSTQWSIGYTGSQFMTFKPDGSPRSLFGDGTSAVYNAVMHLLQNTTIMGGDPYLRYILASDNLSNVPQLLTDLGIAQNYSVYASDPFAFDVALAVSGNAAQYQAWQGIMAQATALGLTHLASDGNGHLVFTGTSADVLAYQAALDGAVAAGDVSSIQITSANWETIDVDDAAIALNGSAASIQAVGVNDTITSNLGSAANVAGSNSVMILGGTGGAAYLYGTSDSALLNGTDNGAWLFGVNDSQWGYIYGTGDTATLNGTGGAMTATTGSTNADIIVNGNNNRVYLQGAGASATFNTSTNSAFLSETGGTVYGSNMTFSVLAGASGITVIGNADTLNLAASTSLNFQGNNSGLYGSNATIHLRATAYGDTVIGSGNLVFAVAGDNFGVTGNNNNVNVSGGIVYVWQGSSGNTFTGNGNDIYGYSGDNFGIVGNGNDIFASNISVTLWGGDTGDTITGNSDGVYGYAGDNFAFAGNGSGINGSNQTVSLLSGDYGDTVAGNGNTVYATAADNFGITGSNNDVKVTSGIVYIWQNGIGNTITGNSNTIYLYSVAGATATATTLSGSYDSITLNGPGGNTIKLTGGTYDTVSGSASALNGTTITGFNGPTDAIDIVGSAYVAGQTVASYKALANSNNQSGTLTISTNGAVIDTLTINAGTSIGYFIVASDGQGGIRVTDPSLPQASTSSAIGAAVGSRPTSFADLFQQLTASGSQDLLNAMSPLSAHWHQHIRAAALGSNLTHSDMQLPAPIDLGGIGSLYPGAHMPASSHTSIFSTLS